MTTDLASPSTNTARESSDAPLIVGVSGLRGIVGQSLTPAVAARFAAAFGTWLVRREHPPVVVVGRDGRAGGDVIARAAIAGLQSVGVDVIDCGVSTTPTTAVMADQVEHAGLIITASHNPQAWNGMKAIWGHADAPAHLRGAAAPAPEYAREIIELFEASEADFVDAVYTGAVDTCTDSADRHADLVAELYDQVLQASGDAPHLQAGPDGADEAGPPVLTAVVDSVNASGHAMAKAGLAKLGVRVVPLFGDDSGIFPHTPEPTRENLSGDGGLCGAVPGLHATIGFAQDPDADRLAIIDESGRYIGEEYTLALAAEALLSAHAAADRVASELGESDGTDEEAGPLTLVANLSTSRMVDDVAAKWGATVVRTPVGEAHVVSAMKRLSDEGHAVVLGGEGNGGVIWPDVCFVRDSLGSMALVLSLMVRTGKTVSELVATIDGYGAGQTSEGGYAIVKRKADIPSKAHAEPAVDSVRAHFASQPGAAIDTQDGVRVDFADRGLWLHVRASNTEPIMRLIAEAPTTHAAEAILDEAAAAIGS